MSRNCRSRCYYCEMPLSPNHEHDHFPIPDRYGGEDTQCACLNCHDLKDRFNLDPWQDGTFTEALDKIRAQGTGARIFLAKLWTMYLDALKRLEQYEERP